MNIEVVFPQHRNGSQRHLRTYMDIDRVTPTEEEEQHLFPSILDNKNSYKQNSVIITLRKSTVPKSPILMAIEMASAFITTICVYALNVLC